MRLSIKALWTLFTFCLLLATGGKPLHSITLAWDANPYSGGSDAGYVCYYGLASGSYAWSTNVGFSWVPEKTNPAVRVHGAVLYGFQSDVTYYFAVTAYDTNGLESDFSNEIFYKFTNSIPLSCFLKRAVAE